MTPLTDVLPNLAECEKFQHVLGEQIERTYHSPAGGFVLERIAFLMASDRRWVMQFNPKTQTFIIDIGGDNGK